MATQDQYQERPAVIHEGLPTQLPDIDPDETQEWLESLDKMIDDRGLKVNIEQGFRPDQLQPRWSKNTLKREKLRRAT